MHITTVRHGRGVSFLLMATKTAKSKRVRAAGYVRLSVLTEETTSLETQRAEIEAFCARQGWDYDPATDLYEDAGFSGSKKEVKRPSFDALMAKLASYDRVVVWKLDRFTRRMAELTKVIEQLEENGAALVTISDNIDTSLLGGRMMANFLGSIAAAEADNTKLRVRSAQATMAKTGRWKGGNRPYGWQSHRRQDGNGVKLVLVPEEAAVLREAVRMALSGKGPGPIAKELNAKGHRSPKGNPWSPQAIKGILTSPLLMGWHEFNGVISRGSDGRPLPAHDPLIDEEKWAQLQAALNQRKTVRPQTDGALLSGVIYCGVCGGRMHGSSSATNPRANYKCRARYMLNKDTCIGTSVKALPVDDLIAEAVLAVLSKARNRQRAVAGLSRVQSKGQASRRALEDQVADASREMDRLLQEREAGHWEGERANAMWLDYFGKCRARLDQAQADLDALDSVESVPIPLAVLDGWLQAKDIRRMWKHRTTAQRREVVRALIERVEIQPPSPEWRHRHFDTDRVVVVWRTGIQP